MRFLITGDIHAMKAKDSKPSKDRITLVRQLFSDIKLICNQRDIDCFIVNGDLWEDKFDPGIDTISCLYDIFNEYSVRSEIVLNCGNHDYPCYCLLDMFRFYNEGFIESKLFVVDKGGYKIINHNESIIYILSWSKPDIFKDNINKIINNNINKKYKKLYLITHCAVKEGRPSLEQKIDTSLSVGDLHPEEFSLVILSDYHNHQVIGRNVVYLGAPFPLCYGDSRNPGVWILDTVKDSLECVELPSFYPQFRHYDCKGDKFESLPGYDPRNYNRITCPVYLEPEYKSRYPESEILPVYGGVVNNDNVRIAVDNTSTEERMSAYIELRQPEVNKTKLMDTGIKHIKEALRCSTQEL